MGRLQELKLIQGEATLYACRTIFLPSFLPFPTVVPAGPVTERYSAAP